MHYAIVCLIIGIIILIHEAGHFFVALLVGIPIDRFSIGFGPKLWGFRKKGTEFRISLIPLGGYVLPKLDSAYDFFKVNPLKRICFSFGGSLANLLSAIIILAFYNTAMHGFSLASVLVRPTFLVTDFVTKIIVSIPLIFTKPEQLSGIVGIVSQGSQIVSYGAPGLLFLATFLNINLGVLNLLPIPALDGGQIILTFLELLWPKTVKARVPLALAGWIFLIFAMIYATTRDISELFG